MTSISKKQISTAINKKSSIGIRILKKNFEITEEIKNKYDQIFDNEYALFLKRKALFDEELLKSKNNIRMASAVRDAAEAAFDAASEEFTLLSRMFTKKGLESRLSQIKSERAYAEASASKDIAEQELTKAKSELNSLKLDRQAKVLAELSEVKSEYLAAFEGIRVAADKADRTQIRAPIDGIVNGF